MDVDCMGDLMDDLDLALELADAADAITLAHFRSADLVVETKPDLTPVSEADRAVEAMLCARLAIARPGDAVLGEEGGASGAGRRRWIIDPIDGTKSFVRGVPVWATLLALEVDGEVVLGVASAPALGRRWWGSRGAGAFADGTPIRVSEVRSLDDAHVGTAAAREFDAVGLGDAYRSITERCWRPVGYADFWGHVLVAEGALIEHCFTTTYTNKAPWDTAFANIRTSGVANGVPAVLIIINRQPGANIIETVDRVRARKGRIAHLDLTIVCEAPRIGAHRGAMRANIARLAGIGVERVGVKATTSEKLGFTGRGEGIAAYATATIRLPWE